MTVNLDSSGTRRRASLYLFEAQLCFYWRKFILAPYCQRILRSWRSMHTSPSHSMRPSTCAAVYFCLCCDMSLPQAAIQPRQRQGLLVNELSVISTLTVCVHDHSVAVVVTARLSRGGRGRIYFVDRDSGGAVNFPLTTQRRFEPGCLPRTY